jgi:parallel beta-helix repeat protein
LLSECDRGISVYRSSSPSITGNTITGNDNGIYVDGGGVSPLPVATGNQIYSNDTWNYGASGFAVGAQNLRLNATGNWWGSTDIKAISTLISDWSDTPTSTTVPSVDFSGLLNAAGGVPIAGNYLVGPLAAASTTFTAGATYEAIGVVQIPADKSLTIQAGARLNFYSGSAALLVDGTLTVQGVSGNLAQITSGRASPTRTDWAGIQIRAGGSAFIEYALIEWAAIGVKTTGVPITVRYSTIRNFTSDAGSGIWVSGSGASGTQIIGNTIRGVNDEGRCIFAEDSSPTITNNSLTDCDVAVSVYRASSPSITGNTMTSNDNGIYVNGGAASPQPIAIGNQIFSNDLWNYWATNFAAGAQNLRLDATGNWWGTTDPAVIGVSISDLNDAYTSTTLPTVDFSGFLDGPTGAPVAGNQLVGPLAATSTVLTAGATYDVLGVTTVPSAKALTIPAGTILRFYSSAALVIDGTLQIQGTPSARVRLTSAQGAPTAGDWQGVVIRSPAAAIDIDNADIEWVVRGVEVQSATVTIRNSLLHHFSTAGIAMTGSGSSSQILNNVIDNYTRIGDGIALANSSPTVTGNRITRTNRALYLSGASKPSVSGNVLTDNNWGIYLFGNNSSSATDVPLPVIHDNDIYGNITAQVEVNAYAAANPALIDASGNWWGTSMPSAGGEIRFSAGSVVSSLDFSNETSASINFDSQAPSAPGNLSALPLSASSIQLGWSASTDDFGVSEYLVERCEGISCTNFTQIGTSNATNYSDGGLTPSAHYRYRVRARDAANLLSGYSAVAGVVAALDTQAPTAPAALDLITASSTQIDLRWSGSTDNSGVVVYVIERCLGAGCSNFVEVANVAMLSYRNTGLTAASSYSYRVRARDSALNFSTYTAAETAVTSITGADCD